jgi:hypothetical protein
MTILKKHDASNWMLKFAWTLEVILCITGVLIAFTLSYIGVSAGGGELTFDQKLILIIGMLPLIGVALAELFKIPMMTGIMYAKSKVAKCIGMFALGAICFLTFETMLTGQEQIMALRSEQIKVQKQRQHYLEEQIALHSAQIIDIDNLKPSDIKKEANEGIQAQLESLNEQIDDLRDREQTLKSSNNSAEVNELLRQIESINLSKVSLVDNHRINLASLNKEKLTLSENEQAELSNATFFKGKIKKDYVERRENLDGEKTALVQNYEESLNNFEKKIASLDKQVAKLSKPSELLQQNLVLIGSQIIDLQNQKNEIIANTNKQIELNVENAKNSKARIDELNLIKAQLSQELNQVRDNLSASTGESFIHRLSALYYGVDNLADLTEEQVGNFALIFMMSVASVVSLAGPLLTYLAYSLVIQEDAPKKRSLKNTLRLGIVSMIKRIRSPKIVTKIKEVEVEKEVIKEVPIEKIRYEEVIKPEVVEVPIFVQVPVPTDPKDLPRIEELEPDNLHPIRAAGGIS